jgi:hypothetical protein
MYLFFHNENNSFLTFNLLNSKLPFISFGFHYFLVVFERICFYFHFNYSDVRIKQIVLFQDWNELKIRLQKRIGFMHIDIICPIFKQNKIDPQDKNLLATKFVL